MVSNIAKLTVSNGFGLCKIDKLSNGQLQFFLYEGMIKVYVNHDPEESDSIVAQCNVDNVFAKVNRDRVFLGSGIG